MIKNVVDSIMNYSKSIEENFLSKDSAFIDIDKSVQLDGYSCGVQSVFVILKYYGKARSIARVEKLLKTTEDGTEEEEIYKLFKEKKLVVYKKLKANFSFIQRAIDYYEAPMLTTIDDGNHYIVVYGYSKKNIFVLDSAPIKAPGETITEKIHNLELKPFVHWHKSEFIKRWDKWGAIIHK